MSLKQDVEGVTMVDSKEAASGKTKKKEPTVKRAVLFELERIAVKGHQIIFDALKETLESKGVTLEPATFSRYCLHHTPPRYLPVLLKAAEKTRLHEDKILSEFTEKVKAAFVDGSLKLSAGLATILKGAEEREIQPGTLTGLDSGTAQSLLENLKLRELVGNRFLSYQGEGKVDPTADTWLRLAKSVGASPGRCVVLASSSASCKAATSAGMLCVAVPDKFTEFEDFGGVDSVEESLGASAAERILDLLGEVP